MSFRVTLLHNKHQRYYGEDKGKPGRISLKVGLYGHIERTVSLVSGVRMIHVTVKSQ